MKKQTLLLGLLAFSFMSCQKELTGPVEPQDLEAHDVSTLESLVVNANEWMMNLPGSTNLTQLSIPGTHDSGARFEPIGGTAKCQDLTISEQLNAGTRFLDIRCRHIDDAFAIHHGSIYQNMNFTDVLNMCYDFLDAHPSETIVMSVKEEYNSSNTTRSFEATFDSYIQLNPSKWYMQASVPDLGDVRGKIVLLRRFGASTTPKGIDATSWADNTTFSISNANASLRVQDQYQVPDNNTKWTNITNLFNESATNSNSTLYINFSSGYKPLIFGIPSITTVSNNINPKLETYFTTNTGGRFGIIPMDFANANRNKLIIDTNF